MADVATVHPFGAHPHAFALAVAERLVDELRPHTDRIEIAGSIRRRVELVKDIEIVAIPKVERDLLGVVDPHAATELSLKIAQLVADGKLDYRRRMPQGSPAAAGPRFKALVAVKAKINVDLFCVLPPAQFGAIYALRTGPADYSKRLVTMCQDRGLRCVDGRLVGEPPCGEIATPEERDFIVACGAEYLEPWERR